MAKEIGPRFLADTRPGQPAASAGRTGSPPSLEPSRPEGARVLSLPGGAHLLNPTVDWRTLTDQRASLREYAPQPFTREELAFLLWCTQGVKSVVGGHTTLRTVPSAGARHAFETYVLANRVEGLEEGLYQYLALSHELLVLCTGPGPAREIMAACYDQSFVAQAAVTLVWVAVPARMTWRYGQRGYRYLFLDAGHVGQNLYLASEAIGAGACTVGAFDDDALNAGLGLDGAEAFAIYAGASGKMR